MLNRDQTHNIDLKLRYNHVLTHDHWWPIGDDVEYQFFEIFLEEITSFVKLAVAGRANRETYAIMNIELSQKMQEHERTTYNLLDFVSDVGGVQ